MARSLRPDGGSSGAGTELGRPRSRRSFFVGGLVAACLALTALDLALVLRVRRLQDRLAVLARQVQARERPLLVEGEVLPTITLLGADGRPVPLLAPEESTATLLFVSSPSCDVCEGVRPTWDAVGEMCAGSHVRVLELVLDAEPASLPVRAGYPAVASGDDAWSLIARIPGVPAALLVDAEGSVLRAFYGVDHDGLTAAVEDYLFP